MKTGYCLSVLAAGALLLGALVPPPACAFNGVDFEVNVYQLTGNRYRMDIIVENLGPARDAIFFFQFWGISSHWETISHWPPEWDFSHPGPQFHFQTGNGSYPSDGFHRLFGQEGAPEPCSGWTGLVFQWTFAWEGGPDPLGFEVMDYLFHIQTIGEEWENDGPSYTYPGPIAIESTTWGGVKSLYR